MLLTHKYQTETAVLAKPSLTLQVVWSRANPQSGITQVLPLLTIIEPVKKKKKSFITLAPGGPASATSQRRHVVDELDGRRDGRTGKRRLGRN